MVSENTNPPSILPLDGQFSNLRTTGTTRRKVRVGARYQEGRLERLGNTIYARFRVDTPNGRKRVAEKICPAEGPGLLPEGKQRRLMRQIIEAAGVNDETKIIESAMGTTFSKQAEWFLKHAQNRKRNPIAASTVKTWESMVDKWLTPTVGRLALAQINNATAKTLVEKLTDAGLSPKTTNNIFGLFSLVISSATNDDGDEQFPRKWNFEKIDMPVVKADEQNTPSFTAEEVNLMIQNTTSEKLKLILILAAASGMRIGEILGLDIRNINEDGTVITVVEKAYGSEVQDFLKTDSGKRIVDLHSTVGKLLREFIGERAGLVFASKKGKPLSQTNLLKRYLHPLMKQLKLTQAGFHSFRRFRATWLDMQSVPDDLTKFWLGHAAKDVTGRYVKYAKQIQYRKEVASTVGVGFDVPAQLSSLVGQSGQKETASSGAPEAVEVTESV